MSEKGKALKPENLLETEWNLPENGVAIYSKLLNYHIIEQLWIKGHSILSKILLFLQSFPFFTWYFLQCKDRFKSSCLYARRT